MATDRERKILEAFLAVAGDGWREAGGAQGLSGLEDGTWENSRPVTTMTTGKAQTGAPASAEAATISTSKAQTELLANYAGLVLSSPVYSQATAASEQGSAGGVLKTVFGNVLGMAPLARLVLGLFGGGDQEEPAALAKYALPAKMRFDAANGPGGSLTRVDYGQSGLPRVYGEAERGEVRARAQETEASGFAEQEGRAGVSGAATQVTIQVQAMDSKSFLDHKEDIARAVREAMLNMHSLNDVVSEI